MVCSFAIAQNKEHYSDGDSCDLSYNLKNNKYYLYDVGYHVTFKTDLHTIRQAIIFTNKYFQI